MAEGCWGFNEISQNSRKSLPEGPVELGVETIDAGNWLAICVKYGDEHHIWKVKLPIPINAEHLAYGIAHKGWEECIKTGFHVERENG